MVDLSNKKILITGAAVGIGFTTAKLLSQLGAHLYILDINENGLQELHSELDGDNNKYILYDLAKTNEIEELVYKIICEFGKLDGMVHCVGLRSRRPLSMLKPEIVENVMHINYVSFIELVRNISRKNNFNPGLSIVAISSISSIIGASSVTAYAASKAAIDSSVRCMAKELAIKGIRINTVMPGQIDTPEYKNFTKNNVNTENKLLDRQYLGLGKPIDVANVIAFLLSDKSRLITGSAIPVDGGFLSS